LAKIHGGVSETCRQFGQRDNFLLPFSQGAIATWGFSGLEQALIKRLAEEPYIWPVFLQVSYVWLRKDVHVAVMRRSAPVFKKTWKRYLSRFPAFARAHIWYLKLDFLVL
jgi:hypothetical protein